MNLNQVGKNLNET